MYVFTCFSKDLSEHVDACIKACKPVLNKNGKTEFSGWNRDSVEVLSSAVVRTSLPDVRVDNFKL